MYRVGRKGRDPWWFTNTGAGRFDLPAPQGTCYLATTPETALAETVEGAGGDRVFAVSTAFVAARRLHRLALPRRLRLASTTSGRALGFGVTREIAAVVPYELPQAWARAWHDHGLDGVWYWPSRDMRARPRSIGLFGVAGAGPSSWARGRAEPIGPELQRDLTRLFGITVFGIPAEADLPWVELPEEG